MWLLKTAIVPVMVGALGMIKKNINKHISRVPSSLSLHEMQKKNCTLRDSSYLWIVLWMWQKNIFHKNQQKHKRKEYM